MKGPRKDIRLADMRGKPMTAAWYHYLCGLRSNIAILLKAHERAARDCKNRTAWAKEQDEVAQRITGPSLEYLDLIIHTMEVTGGACHVDGRDD